jgi:S-adenosylmethionine/arginine decarboxylase-like enzyme
MRNKMSENLDLKREFAAMDAWGLLTSLDIHGCAAELIRDADMIKRFVAELCDLIQMKRFGETTVVDFGDDPRVSGFSMTQLIETSLISAHFANQSNSVYLDIFSCKYYDPTVAAEFAKRFFKGKDYHIHVALRK